MIHQGVLGLSIRETEILTPVQVEKITPRHINKWKKELAIANTSEVSKRLYQLLLECNKSDLNSEERFKILMILHSVAEPTLKNLSKFFTGQTLHLSNRQKKIVALLQALHTEMAIGFKMIVEKEAENVHLLNRKMIHHSLILTLDYLSLTILRCYQVYTSVPSRLWQEVNIIYRYAMEQKIENKACQPGNGHTTSINECFLKVCLLSMANPYQLRQHELESIFKHLTKYTQFCQLKPMSRFNTQFFINLEHHHPPQHLALKEVRPSQYTLRFDLDPLVEQLQIELKERSHTKSKHVSLGYLSTRLLRHLLKNWAHLTSRNFSRTHSKGDLLISVGLAATHHFISQHQEVQSVNDETSDDVISTDSRDTTTIDQLEGSLNSVTLIDNDEPPRHHSDSGFQRPTSTNENDIWEKLYRPKQALPSKEEIDYAHALSPHLSPTSHQLLEADIINMSPGGYCLCIYGQLPKQVQTGEIIGLQLDDVEHNDHWNIGVICWIKRHAKIPGVHLGVQLIAPSAKAVKTQIKNQLKHQEAYQNALVLPELKGIGQPPTLVISPILFNKKQHIDISDGHYHFNAMLTQLVSATQSYNQFYFEPTTPSPLNKKMKSTQNKRDDYDNVWDLI